MIHEVVIVVESLEIVEKLDARTSVMNVVMCHIVAQISNQPAGKYELRVDEFAAKQCDRNFDEKVKYCC